MTKPNIPEGNFKHTMLDPQFGKLVPENFPDERDAIHIATCAVYAEHDLNPGDHVGFNTKRNDVMGRTDMAPLGIVDPFLTEPVKKGQRFWVFLYPGTIRSLRHNWSHPAFDSREKLIKAIEETPSSRRLKAFAAEIGTTYDELILRATEYVTQGYYWSEGSRFEGTSIYEGFWTDFEIETGITVPDDDRYNFFSCAC